MRQLLDTCLVSELRKIESGRANPGVIAWARANDGRLSFISTVTVLEIETGARLLERRDARQAAVLLAWLEKSVLATFEGRILAVDVRIARECGRILAERPGQTPDALIAATARVHNLGLVTRNVTDFGGLGLRVVNPWLS